MGDGDIYTLIQNDILFNNEENKNEWNINELSLGIYMYHNNKTDKRMKIFNINTNLYNWKDTLLYSINNTGNNTNLFWKHLFKYYTTLEEKEDKKEKIIKFIFQD